MTRLDSRIEEWIASRPGLAWFDSRRSGDPIGYLHKVIWVAVSSALAWLLRQPAWWGGALYSVVYAVLKVRGTAGHWHAWRSGESRLGPLRDYREPPKPGLNFGFMVDAVLDLIVAFGFTALIWWLG